MSKKQKNSPLTRGTNVELCRFLAWMLTSMIVIWGGQVQAGELRYRYVSLNQIAVPPNVSFYELFLLNDQGRIYGNAFECADVDCTFLNVYVVSLEGGKLVLGAEANFYASSVNKQGTIGGGKVDPQSFITQAAVARQDKIDLVPPIQPDEFFAELSAINDRGVGIVNSFAGETFTQALALYKRGESIPLTIDEAISGLDRLRINNQNLVSGRGQVEGQQRGFRFNPATRETVLLEPLSTEPHSWAMDINSSGNVLGYSFKFSGIERIGVWDKDAKFNTYFVEGTPEFPTISNNLLFNDSNLIVITRVSSPQSERNFTYLVTKPGKRVNLADLVENLPTGHSREFAINDINNRGDLLGIDRQGIVLLKRIDN